MGKLHTNIKDSGIEWLGEVPEHWEVKRLKYVTSCNDESLPETTDPDYQILYVDISSVSGTSGIIAKEEMSFEDAPSRARRIVKDGDTIVSTVRTYLKAIAAINDAEENLIVSTGFAVLRPFNMFPSYLSLVIQSHYVVESIVARSFGVSYPAINASDIGNIFVPVPPINEQLNIANKVQNVVSSLDVLIQKKEQMIEMLKEKRIALITQAVTKGLDSKVKMKDSGIEWLGEVPEHWEIARVGHGFSIQLGKMLQPEQDKDTDVLVPYLKAINVQWDTIHVDDENQMWASPDEIEKYGVRKGDLLVCEGGEAGRAAILTEDIGTFIIQNALHRVRSSNNNVEYLKYLLQVAANQSWFDILCNKATIAHFTREKFAEMLVPFPTLAEQNAIVQYLADKIQGTQLIIDKITSSISLLREYRVSLIHHAVTGKIDLRGYDDQL